MTASYDGTIENEQVDTNSNTYQITVGGSLTATSPSDSTHTILLAYFGNSLASAVSSGTAYPLVAGVPADGCSPLSYPYKLPGKVVLLARGNCTFQTKVSTVKEHSTYGPATWYERAQSYCLSACVCACMSDSVCYVCVHTDTLYHVIQASREACCTKVLLSNIDLIVVS